MSGRRRVDAHGVVLALTWLAAAGALAGMLALGIRGTDRFGGPGAAIHAGYVVALLWHLGRS